MERTIEKLGFEIIGAAFEVRKHLGRFLYEDIYEQALQIELKNRGIESKRQVSIPVKYKGIILENSYRMDLLVENQICIELKSLEYMGKVEISQILSYLKFANLELGFLINFGTPDFKTSTIIDTNFLDKGIYRLVYSM